MKLVVAVLCLMVVALEASTIPARRSEWELFKQEFARNYKNEAEEQRRMQIFFNNLDLIDQHNSKFDLGKATFKMGVTRFADMTNDEFRSIMLPPRPKREIPVTETKRPTAPSADPASVDWRPKGYVTPVKDQGNCGSCWAFSTTGMLEGATFNWTGVLPSLSEQNLIDCSTSYGNSGCGGGWQEYATDYIVANGGIDSETSYPYEGMDGTCRYDPAFNTAQCGGWTRISPLGDEIVQRTAVATQGPVSFSMYASMLSFQLYKSGIYNDPNCLTGFLQLDHAVLGVGYDTDVNGVDYWIVKNSWGTGWGEAGYFNIFRGNNTCGIATDSLYVLPVA